MKRTLRRVGGPLHPLYCVGGGVPENTTSETTTKLSPELGREIGPFADFTRKQIKTPFAKYKGNLVAGFDPDQIDAFNLGRQGSGAQEQYASMLAQGPFQGGMSADEQAGSSYINSLLGGGLDRITGGRSANEGASENFLGGFFDPNRQNPYFEEQLGIGRKRIGEQYAESIAPGIAGKYALSGAFGGTAQSEAEGRSQRELVRGLGEYETGARSAEQERRYAQGLQAAGLTEQTSARRISQGLQGAGLGLQGAGQIETTAGRRGAQSLADAQLRSALIGQGEQSFQNDFTRLLGIGQQEQGQRQAVLDKKYEQFLRKQGYPKETFNMYRDAIAALTGAGGGGSTQSGTSMGGGPSDVQTGVGAATTAAALYALYASQAASTAATTVGTAACWVAREVFGSGIKWMQFRDWMIHRSPRWFFSLYMRHGERLAGFLNSHPWLKSPIRWWMEYIIRDDIVLKEKP